MMKTTVAAALAAGMAIAVSGCSYTAPARTFKAGGFSCSETAAEIKVDAAVAKELAAIVRLKPADANLWDDTLKEPGERPPTHTEIKEWFEFCRKFLSDETVP